MTPGRTTLSDSCKTPNDARASAAWDAARDKQNKRLTEMVMAAHEKEGK